MSVQKGKKKRKQSPAQDESARKRPVREEEIPELMPLYKKLEPVVQALSRHVFLPFYQFTRYLGMQTYRYTRRVCQFLVRLIKKPLRMLWFVLYTVLLAIDKFLLKSVHAVLEEAAYLRKEVRASGKTIREAFQKNKKSLPGILAHYIKEAFVRHKGLFRRIGNVLLPVAACLCMIITIGYFNGVTFALEVNYNGKTLGYIENEAVYINARDAANKRIGIGSDLGSSIVSQPKYALKIVGLSKLTDSSVLSDRLIAASESNLTNACGIYIDGEFLCAVKNETDAMSVLDALLAPARAANPGAIAEFVEDVEYVQGLYPDTQEVMWDAAQLRETLNGTKQSAVYYTVQTGDTISGIAQKHDKSSSELFAMNPGLTEEIHVGQQITVSTQVKFLRVKIIKTETRDVETPYETVETKNDSIFKGSKKVKQAGQKGLVRVTELVSYVDGVRVSAQEVERVTLKDPVTEYVDVGTKSLNMYGSYTVTPAGNDFVWPVIGLYTVNSRYGIRWSRQHKGIDITGSSAHGKTIVAAKGGRVEQAGNRGDGYGLCVVINHGGGLKTRYAHCSYIGVSVGEYVSQGQAIGRVGSTGYSTGPHLHFEVIVNGTPVNPLPYLGRS